MAVKVRSVLVRQHTQLGNSLRAMIAEFGIIARAGDRGLEGLIGAIESGVAHVPEAALVPLSCYIRQWRALGDEIAKLTVLLLARAKANPTVKRLMAVPGVGPLSAMVFALKVDDPDRFRCGRNCAAWLGLAPNEHSTAGKRRIGSISKEGDENLRTLLVLGAATVLIRAKRDPASAMPWVAAINQALPLQGCSRRSCRPQRPHPLGASQARHSLYAAPRQSRIETSNSDVNRFTTCKEPRRKRWQQTGYNRQDTPLRHCATKHAGMIGTCRAEHILARR
jgi:transposase